MRDLTKSMVSFSWAMWLFGAQQMAKILSPSKAAGSFNTVTEATKKEFSGAAEATFQAGENLQRGLVDMTFRMLSPEIFNPNTWIKTTSDVVQQTVGALRQAMPGAPGAQSQSTGWGPVSPVDK